MSQSTTLILFPQTTYDGGGTANYKAFGGYMACARIYNRALTNAEISQNYELDKTRFGI